METPEPSSAPASTPTAKVPAAGAILDGRFRVERLIGKGGMGYVLAAMHLELEQRVAIKLLSPEREHLERGASRLLREARASARIRSEHVVRVLDVVQGRENPPYMVLEYLEGEDLARRLSRRGKLDAAEAVDLILQACEAVGEGHRLGIVHRDLKPSNLFLCSRPGRNTTLKVLDFGISKMQETGASLTQSYALLGSPIYSAPEQLRSSRDVDARADIWSLGIVLYECVTGTRPFGGETLAQVCTSILHDTPRSPRAVEPRVPAALESVLLRCLRTAPEERYQSIEELVEALHDFAPRAAERCASYLSTLPPADEVQIARRAGSAVPQQPRSVPSDTLTGSAEYDSRDGSSSATRHASSARRRVTVALGLAALVLGGIAGWQTLQAFDRAEGATVITRSASAARPIPAIGSSAPSVVHASATPPHIHPPAPAPPPAPTASVAVATPQRRASTKSLSPSSRTAGPKRPAPSIAPIAPWVDTR